MTRPQRTEETNLARQVEAAQSILALPLAGEAIRLERAAAACSAEVAVAMARLDPSSGASVQKIAGGLSIFAGKGSPLTQGLALGLAGPVTDKDLDALEAHLCPDGSGAHQLELSPFVDPSLPALLGRRGFRVQEWQLVWTRPVPSEPQQPPPAGLRVERVRPGQEELCLRTILAGFLETEEVPPEMVALMLPSASAAQHESYLAWLGEEPIGGASLSWADGVAFVNGSGVRPAFRRNGAQGALIRARLDRARELGCAVACSSTLPGTASRRNMERHGFRVEYPKLVMLRDVARGS